MTKAIDTEQLAAAPAEGNEATTQNVQVHLRRIPLLAGLSDEEVQRLKPELRFRQYNKRDIVLQKGAAGDGLLFLLSGQLQVIDVTEDGRAIGLRMLAPGDFFGEIAVINGSQRTASVVAMSSVLVAFLPAPAALHLFSHSPSVANLMLRHLAAKIQRDSEFRSLLSINNTSRRIYTYLVQMKTAPEQPGDPEVVKNLPTHQDIANMINTSRETVTRALAALVQQGIIQKVNQELRIVDPQGLQKLVEGP
ncbi:cAMP-binding domain of CRP or a regulatory subunit of cAMP-dependent protein kinases [Duganella sacchari]|uniref:cAMP-binding domain of CRP or a regulatory subunit of cAMP-dependent protein kinases n=1 Tax=Duganella sacchari TaxID=551987 RepID=A0A1M7R8Q3_9BURK|nr:Crp/Fnr family transcriptional regulator [Duganella sacchari]SHN42613.1 cAMP-binding domain of CRP or a regulatory subunit of cAMP-dependent protein kinases [Duganella sacchari]